MNFLKRHWHRWNKGEIAASQAAQMEDFTRLIATGSFPLTPQMTPFRFNLIPGGLGALERIDRVVAALDEQKAT